MEYRKIDDEVDPNKMETKILDAETMDVLNNVKVVKNEEAEKAEEIHRRRSRSGGKRAKSHEIEKPRGKKKKLTKEEKRERRYYIDKKGKKRLKKRYKFLIFLLALLVILAIVFTRYVVKSGGDVKTAVLSMASDIVGEQDPIFVLILGVSEDIRTPLTDTIILAGYNPKTQKAFMLSIPRDTFVGKNPEYANGYDKINAKFQVSAERTKETVELITGVTIDHYVIIRNLKIADIFETIGSIDFDVPIDMDYDDPTQDLHIHLKKGYQTLQPDQIEQLLRFRHNNNGTSYPASYGDNDYGRMKTQRNFIKACIDQTVKIQNVGKVKDIIAYAYTNVQTTMPGSEVLNYVPYGLQFSTSNLRSEQLPGQSAMINQLWFYQHSKSKTKKLVDELMIYLELDDETLRTHYKYGEALIGVKPDDNWVSNEVVKDYVIPNAIIRDTNTVVDQETCKHVYGVVSDSATCGSDGTVVKRCALCDKVIEEPSKATGNHDFEDGFCVRCGAKDPNYKKPEEKKPENKVTNEVVDNTPQNETPKPPTNETPKPPHTEHDYSVFVNKVEPTCGKAGYSVYKCSGCDKTTQKDQVPATGAHTYPNGTSSATCSVCGAANPDYVAPEPQNPDPGTGGDEGGNENGGSLDGSQIVDPSNPGTGNP